MNFDVDQPVKKVGEDKLGYVRSVLNSGYLAVEWDGTRTIRSEKVTGADGKVQTWSFPEHHLEIESPTAVEVVPSNKERRNEDHDC